jgi:hypothetical protein
MWRLFDDLVSLNEYSVHRVAEAIRNPVQSHVAGLGRVPDHNPGHVQEHGRAVTHAVAIGNTSGFGR